ncbi:MAG TPA: POTRA domain-containing protein [Syntrophobacteraceae bacterium]|nr:POTRA domain-containing protein [Syntrophobacteraceae bacterium]
MGKVGAFYLPKRFLTIAVLLPICLLPALAARCFAQKQPARELSFPIEGFLVEGNNLLPPEAVQNAIESMIGPGKKSDDVEVARETLEKLYHSRGYPTVLVSIPEQSVQEGIIRLDVTEGKIAKVTTTENRYVTADKLLRSLPSMKPGEVPYAPEVQKEFGKANENPDVKVTPSLTQGSEPGTVDVDLKVEDKLPLHASVELNNRSSPHTTDLRLNAVIHYDNFWQMDHSLSLQYQNSPQDPNEVEVGAASYSLPAPWNPDHLILLTGIWSDSNTASGEGFTTVGRGHQFGLRYVMPLPALTNFTQNLIAGVDYKDFRNLPLQLANLPSSQSSGENPPVTYFPLSFTYNSYLADRHGVTQFSTGLNMAFRGLISDEKVFTANRAEARGNYLYGTGCVERTQDLIAGAKLFVKVDGQLSDSPLINNEEYAGGGLESVRGYRETEALGDCAQHCTVQLLAPEMAASHGIGNGKLKCTPYVFYDEAHILVLDPLPGQKGTFDLEGAGIGVKGLYRCVEYETCWATALSTSQSGVGYTKAGDSRVHFRVKYLY